MTKKKLWRSLAVLAIVFLLAELGTRLYLNKLAAPVVFDKFASMSELHAQYGEKYATHRYLVYYPRPDYISGANQHNAFGFRGAEIERIKPEGIFRIVVLGADLVYGDGVKAAVETIPAYLQDQLGDAGVSNIEVINAGVPGYASWETLLNLEQRALDIQPDLVVVFLDARDVGPRLVWPAGAYTGDNSGYLSYLQTPDAPWFERSVLLRLLLVQAGALPANLDALNFWRTQVDSAYEPLLYQQIEAGTYPSGMFAETSALDMLAANPPIYFERNVLNMRAVAAALDVPIVFVMSPYGLIGNAALDEIYETALAEQAAFFEQTLCDADTLCLDLSSLSTDTALFVDTYNLAAPGNALIAERLQDFLHEEGFIE